MKITKFEQSGFIFETNKGFRLAVDIGSYTPVEELENVRADAMLISHIHGDHFSLEQIKKLFPKKLYINHECHEAIGQEKILSEIVEIKGGSQIKIEDTSVSVFDVDHGPNVSLKENLGFFITMDDKKIYFPGDMFYPSGIDVTGLEVDYALLPVGTFYTFGPEEAFAFAKIFKKIEKIIIMHERRVIDRKNQFIRLAEGHFSIE